MGQQELKRCRRQRHFVFGADSFDLLHLLHDVGGCGRIVVLGAGDRACRQDAAVEAAAYDDGGIALLAQWQEFIERVLFQQRIAPGKQETVEIALLQGLVANLPFIDAEADGLDHAFLAHLEKRLVGSLHRLLEIDRLLCCAVGEHIAIVNEGDVDPSQVPCAASVSSNERIAPS